MSPSTYTDLLYACASSRVRFYQFVLMAAEGAETNVENVLAAGHSRASRHYMHSSVAMCIRCIPVSQCAYVPDTAILCYVKGPLG